MNNFTTRVQLECVIISFENPGAYPKTSFKHALIPKPIYPEIHSLVSELTSCLKFTQIPSVDFIITLSDFFQPKSRLNQIVLPESGTDYLPKKTQTNS
jgi:hypothetical protein